MGKIKDLPTDSAFPDKKRWLLKESNNYWLHFLQLEVTIESFEYSTDAKSISMPFRGIHSTVIATVVQSFSGLRLFGLQHARLPCPSPSPEAVHSFNNQ